MHIVFVSPEIAPAVKVGGLADVVQGLGRDLGVRGHRVEVILPKYDCVDYGQVADFHRDYDELFVPYFDKWIRCSVDTGVVGGLRCFFVDAVSEELFFNRGVIYGHDDDIDRFAFLCRASLEYMLRTSRTPDIIHCHDWQTGLVPVLLAEVYKWSGMAHPRVCFTIHNVKHQGRCGTHILRQVGLDPKPYLTQDRLEDTWHPGAVNLLKAGIVYSNWVTTVSPTYMEEIRTTHLGHGMEPTLAVHASKLTGVLNGVDPDIWTPERDPNIAAPFSVDSMAGKALCKDALRRRLGLCASPEPLLSVVSRLDEQKGVHMIRRGIEYALELGAQFVLLGTAPEAGIAADFARLRADLLGNPDVHLELGFDGRLAHQIYAGADMILIPSMFEPCGLTQLIGMRYGTVPIVRRTGGLGDTVFDAETSDVPLEERNGFTFDHLDDQAVEWGIRRAVETYRRAPETWRRLQRAGMAADHSWESPGRRYVEIYEAIRAW